jgi:subtilase family serine protease
MRSIAKRPTGRSLLLRAALAVGVLGALVGAASAVAASPTPLTYSKAVCPAVPVGYAHCLSYVVTNKAGVPLVSPKAVSGYGPVQFQTAYGLTAAAAASTNEVIAIVDAYDNPNAKSDLDAYSTNFGLPILPTCSGPSNVGCFKKVNQTGGSAPPAGDTGWGLEIALDVDTAHAVCPKCGILLVEANSNSFSNLLAAEDWATSHASVVSNSWGGSEFSLETSSVYDGHFNRPGVAITVSSGDSGYGVEYPAASRYVTAVGGTHLVLDGSNNRSSETVWSGAGSGCSAYEAKPAWQADPSCTKRTVADVSADADPSTGAAVYDTYGYGGWLQVGGTSLAAPLIGAVYALAGVGGTSDYPSSYPYAHTSSLYDVTSGSNGSCGLSYLCTGKVGYDGPTGLGTPNGTTAFASGGGGGGGSAPTVTSFSPTSGPVGTSVVISGTNFTGVTAVKFHGTSATTYTVNSSVQITATVPSGATSGTISVSNGSGTGTSSSSFTVTTGGGSAPTITSFSPTFGFTGTKVTINGTGFTGTTSVKLGSTSASFTVNSATRITATVPSMLRGNYKWQVTTPNGTATSAGNFHHF